MLRYSVARKPLLRSNITAAPYSVNEQTHVMKPRMLDRIHRTKVLLYDDGIAKPQRFHTFSLWSSVGRIPTNPKVLTDTIVSSIPSRPYGGISHVIYIHWRLQ